MKRLYLFLIFGLCVLNMYSGRKEPYRGSRIFWDMRSQQTIFDGGWYARLIQLQDGRLLAVTEVNWDIVISTSEDNGRTWSPQKTVFHHPEGFNYYDADLYQLSDGKIIITYNIGFPSVPGGRFGVRLHISEDNGETWGDEIFVYDGETTFENGCWEPAILELPSGEVHLYVSDEAPYVTSGEQCIQLMRSFDRGKTWSAPQTVSFRPGSRDGMPTPVIVGDSIVLTIEDNGWPGMESFVPVTVRTSIEDNWSNAPVGANSPYRSQVIDYDWCPLAFGGAPYMRVLPWGETLLSRQSYYESGNYGVMNMYVYVGDENARNFKAMSQPFPDNVESGISIEVNSVSVVDTGEVCALGGFVSGPNGRHVDMVKGYPRRMLKAYYGHPTLDGAIGTDEYHTPEANQIMMGTNSLGHNVYADLSYDNDCLYFVANVDDNTPTAGSSQSRLLKDGVRLLIDADNVSDTAPVKGMFDIFFSTDGKFECLQGDNGYWTECDLQGISCKVNVEDDHYVIEAAIPWQALGKTGAPTGQRMAAGIEVQDRCNNGFVSESIPDVRHDESWTWMELRLDDNGVTDGIHTAQTADDNNVTVKTDGDRLTFTCDGTIDNVKIYSADGRLMKTVSSGRDACSTEVNGKGMMVATVTMTDGSVINKKIIK